MSKPIKSYTLAELRGLLVIAIDFNQPPRRTLETRERVRNLRWRIRAKREKLSPSSPQRRHRGVSADAD